MITHAFTCTGPYALLIMLGIKRVENRSAVPEPRTGRCAIIRRAAATTSWSSDEARRRYLT